MSAPLALEELRCIGPKSCAWLRAVGITSVAELRRLGAVEAYGRITFRVGREANVNLLYALDGALRGRGYNELSKTRKARLRAAAGLADRPLKRRMHRV